MERSKKRSKIKVGLVGVSAAGLAVGSKLAIRGHRLRKLESLVPKLVTDNPQTFRSKLKAGDLLLVGKDGLKGKALAASKFTRPSEGLNVHTAMYIGNNELIDVVPKGNKIRRMKIDPYLKKNMNILVVRPNEPKSKIDLSVKIAKGAHRKNEYRYRNNLLINSAKGLTGDFAFEKKLTRMLFKDRVNRSKVICSTAIADIQTRAGFKKFKKAPSMMTTIDFRSMKKPPLMEFNPMGKNKYKTSKLQGAGFIVPSLGLGAYGLKD